MKHQQPIVNQFLESEQDFSYDINNRNLCFGGSAGKALKDITGGVYNPEGAEQLSNVDLYSATKTNLESMGKEVGMPDPYDLTQQAIEAVYGKTAEDTTDVTTDDTMNETTMTAEEKRNKLRQLMASRYGRRETILTGGTGLSDFGV